MMIGLTHDCKTGDEQLDLVNELAQCHEGIVSAVVMHGPFPDIMLEAILRYEGPRGLRPAKTKLFRKIRSNEHVTGATTGALGANMFGNPSKHINYAIKVDTDLVGNTQDSLMETIGNNVLGINRVVTGIGTPFNLLVDTKSTEITSFMRAVQNISGVTDTSTGGVLEYKCGPAYAEAAKARKIA